MLFGVESGAALGHGAWRSREVRAAPVTSRARVVGPRCTVAARLPSVLPPVGCSPFSCLQDCSLRLHQALTFG